MVIELRKGDAVYDITKYVTKFTWGGSLDQASRSVEFSTPNAPYDTNLKDFPRIALGDFISLSEAGKQIYFGMVYDEEKTTENGEINHVTYDLLYHFLKSSWCKNYKNTKPETIVKDCCAEVGISMGNIANTNVNIPTLLLDNVTLYDSMLKAYTKASLSNGKQYHFLMNVDKLDIIEKGVPSELIILSDNENIIKANTKESITEMVNRIKIYDDKQKQKGVVSNDEYVKKYGVFQGTYTEEKGVASKQAAESLLVAPTQEMRVESVGHINAVSGYAITVQDKATGLNGLYWIVEDRHTFENGTHTMSLTLNFKNIMASVDMGGFEDG